MKELGLLQFISILISVSLFSYCVGGILCSYLQFDMKSLTPEKKPLTINNDVLKWSSRRQFQFSSLVELYWERIAGSTHTFPACPPAHIQTWSSTAACSLQLHALALPDQSSSAEKSTRNIWWISPARPAVDGWERRGNRCNSFYDSDPSLTRLHTTLHFSVEQHTSAITVCAPYYLEESHLFTRSCTTSTSHVK